ncbi:unnamed protein product [Echinostoma caproni]|uniref:WAS/WASL-interacting protein family member 2 n=1 Tax=Echinostoma caproni TaxID=27848 RepID=A0A183B6X1_9TREM|nr:unnamed protein product [Echinostoma caproni]
MSYCFQRTGLPSTEPGAGAERSTMAKPKVIRINSAGGPMPPPPPPPISPSAQLSSQSPSYYVSQSSNQRNSYQFQHPPPPPPPNSAVPRLGPDVAALSAEFERRFRFLNDRDLPPPPASYKGPRTYRTASSRTG